MLCKNIKYHEKKSHPLHVTCKINIIDPFSFDFSIFLLDQLSDKRPYYFILFFVESGIFEECVHELLNLVKNV